MRTNSLTRILVTAIALAAPSSLASAQCPSDALGCHEEGVDFHWREGFLDSAMLDTGWVPAGSPLQVRFAVFVGGETEVDLAGTSFTWWPRPLSVSVPGIPETGRVAIDYGIEFVARVRFDVTVAGTRYTWEGDIPTGSIPRDLRVASSGTFDSMLLPPQMPRPVAISDATERFEAYGLDLAGIIGIPGVSGGLAVEVDGALGAAYQTDRIEIGDAVLPIEEEGAATVAGPDAGETDFGAAKDVVIQPVGHLDYDGVVNLYPVLYIEVVGRRFDAALPSIPVPLVSLGREVRFDPATVHVPLPDVRVTPIEIDFGALDVGTRADELLEIRNEGEAELVVTPRAPRMPFEAPLDPIVIAARSSRSIEVGFAPVLPGRVEAMFFLETNDPDQALIAVRLSGEGVGTIATDGGRGDAGPRGPGSTSAGGCGCRAGSGSAAPAWALLIGVLMVIRRRRIT